VTRFASYGGTEASPVGQLDRARELVEWHALDTAGGSG
jgi:hypothetical protein